MKYKEDLVLDEVKKYVEKTYKEHYTSDDGLQVLDVWKALGNFDTSCRDAALKYLYRFGKKNGYNKDDLLKAMHFIMYMYSHHFLKDKKTTEKKTDNKHGSIKTTVINKQEPIKTNSTVIIEDIAETTFKSAIF